MEELKLVYKSDSVQEYTFRGYIISNYKLGLFEIRLGMNRITVPMFETIGDAVNYIKEN